MRPSACISVDIDATRLYAAIHGLEAPQNESQDPIFTLALGRLLDFFQEEEVPSTLFCVGADLHNPRTAETLQHASQNGHELGNHTQNHLYNLRSQPLEEIREEIVTCGKALEALTGKPTRGFRTPGYNTSPEIAQVCAQEGYLYDSSILPSPPYYLAKGAVMALGALRGQPSRSQMNLPQVLQSPLSPYRIDPSQPWKPDPQGPIWQVPMCSLPLARVPFIGTSLHLFGDKGISAIMPLLRRAHPKLFNLEFHAIDWLDAKDPGIPPTLLERQPDLHVPLETKLRTYRAVFAALRPHYSFRTLTEAVEKLDEGVMAHDALRQNRP